MPRVYADWREMLVNEKLDLVSVCAPAPVWQDFDRSLAGASAAGMDGLAGRCDLAVVEAVYRQIGADAVSSS